MQSEIDDVNCFGRMTADKNTAHPPKVPRGGVYPSIASHLEHAADTTPYFEVLLVAAFL